MCFERSNKTCESYNFDIFDANTKRILFASILSILPGLGQVYTGRLLRGLIGLTGLVLISWVSAILFLFIESRTLSLCILSIPFIYALGLAVDAAFCAICNPSKIHNQKNKIRLHLALYVFLFIFVTLLMDQLIGTNVVRAFVVTSESMHPKILKLDIILVDKITDPNLNDIVLIDFNNSNNNESISNIIINETLRRIIASEGDTVEIRGKQLYINNQPVVEKYAIYGDSKSLNIYTQSSYRWGPDVVPDNSFFVLADSRHYGFDSRSLGFIERNYINGIASKILWSWNLDNGHFKWDRTALNIQ
ncbi:MAG: signal peptidase I [Candidatus Thiodiazotropha sp.]